MEKAVLFLPIGGVSYINFTFFFFFSPPHKRLTGDSGPGDD